DDAIAATHGRIAMQSLEDAGYHVYVETMTALEEHKTLKTVHSFFDEMMSNRLERSSPVVALGGGITGDTAGFAAATWLRGVPLIQVPTTLLAMVDASIGGKTGVNLTRTGSESGLAKNLIGAFWQPRLILADPRTLTTLEDRHFRCGLAECIKHAIIAGEEHLRFMQDSLDAILARDDAALLALISTSASIKIHIVEQDERESGVRALLNLGHTFAHAIEAGPDNPWLHGEAVAIGLLAAARCSSILGKCEVDCVDEIQSLLGNAGLPTALEPGRDVEQLMQAMTFDKKVKDGRVRLILPLRIGACAIVEDVPQSTLREVWDSVGARV
ncbi:MAG: 3-dehydroquinate synthase, partial [Phycisphaerales bacterium]